MMIPNLDQLEALAYAVSEGTLDAAARALDLTPSPLASPAFAERWLADGPTPAALAVAPVVVFDRADALQDRYLRRRTRRRSTAPRHHVPSSADFHSAVRLGLGWGLLPDLQAADDLRSGALVEFDPGTALDVRLHWQQWRIHSDLLGEVAAAVRTAAADALRDVGRSALSRGRRDSRTSN